MPSSVSCREARVLNLIGSDKMRELVIEPQLENETWLLILNSTLSVNS